MVREEEDEAADSEEPGLGVDTATLSVVLSYTTTIHFSLSEHTK